MGCYRLPKKSLKALQIKALRLVNLAISVFADLPQNASLRAKVPLRVPLGFCQKKNAPEHIGAIFRRSFNEKN